MPTSLHFRVPQLLLGLALAISSTLRAAKPESELWHINGGQVVAGHLSEVYGSLALITGKDIRALVPLDKMSDEELGRVADLLAKPGRQNPTWEKSDAQVTKAVRRNLEYVSGDRLSPWPATGREPKVYLIYFSAGWCAPCHRFTPRLVKAYDDWQQSRPGEVEVIFVSSDENSLKQQHYALEMKMPWKALKYSRLNSVPEIEKWAGNGIPCLVALTPSGEVIFHSYREGKYVGPDYVLDTTKRLLQQTDLTRTAKVTQHRLAVIQHIRSNPESVPLLYLADIDASRYQTLDVDEVIVSLTIDPQGHVSDSEIQTPLSAVLKEKLHRDLAQLLFLPAVIKGVPEARTLILPLPIRATKTASTTSRGTSGN